MTSFIQKKLPSIKSLPEIIKDSRLKLDLSLEDLAIKANVAAKYLLLLEKGSYHLLPGEVYVKQFIKKLAKFFHLNEKGLWQIYQKEKDYQPLLININSGFKKKITIGWLSPKIFRNLLVFVLISAFVGYFGWELKNIFDAPKLEIFSPQSQAATQDSSITISGQTQPESSLKINRQSILINPDGNFSETVDLTIGLNVFTISASKKHSREAVKTISILRQGLATAEINMQTGVTGYNGVVNN